MPETFTADDFNGTDAGTFTAEDFAPLAGAFKPEDFAPPSRIAKFLAQGTETYEEQTDRAPGVNFAPNEPPLKTGLLSVADELAQIPGKWLGQRLVRPQQPFDVPQDPTKS